MRRRRNSLINLEDMSDDRCGKHEGGLRRDRNPIANQIHASVRLPPKVDCPALAPSNRGDRGVRNPASSNG